MEVLSHFSRWINCSYKRRSLENPSIYKMVTIKLAIFYHHEAPRHKLHIHGGLIFFTYKLNNAFNTIIMIKIRPKNIAKAILKHYLDSWSWILCWLIYPFFTPPVKTSQLVKATTIVLCLRNLIKTVPTPNYISEHKNMKNSSWIEIWWWPSILSRSVIHLKFVLWELVLCILRG